MLNPVLGHKDRRSGMNEVAGIDRSRDGRCSHLVSIRGLHLAKSRRLEISKGVLS